MRTLTLLLLALLVGSASAQTVGRYSGASIPANYLTNTNTRGPSGGSVAIAMATGTTWTLQLDPSLADGYTIEDSNGNDFINIDTDTDAITFGNASTNPTFTFLGSGALTLPASLSWGTTISLTGATTITGTAGETLTLARTLTDATSEGGFTINTTAEDTSSGTTQQYGLILNNIGSTEGLDALLRLNNADADDSVAAAILVQDLGGGGYTKLLDTGSLDISGTGAITGATGVTTTGVVDADSYTANAGSGIDVQSAGALDIGNTTATSIDFGSAAVTGAFTFTNDGTTGDATVVLPAGSIGAAEILDGAVSIGVDTDNLTGDVTTSGSAATTIAAGAVDYTMIDQTAGLATTMASNDVFVGSGYVLWEGATGDGNVVSLTVGADPGGDVAITLPTAAGALVGTGDTGTITAAMLGADVVDGTELADTITLDAAFALGANGQTIAIDSSDWDISATGVMTGIGNITSDGTIDANAYTADAGAGLDTQAAGALLLGAATATSVEIADSAVLTDIQGTLSVDEAATFDQPIQTAVTAAIGTAGSSGTATEYGDGWHRTTVITGLSIAHLVNSGTSEVVTGVAYTFPRGMLTIHSCMFDGTVSSPTITDTATGFAVGTAAATDGATLLTTEQDIMQTGGLDGAISSGGVTHQDATGSSLNGAAATPMWIDATTTQGAAATANINMTDASWGATDTITITGTLTIVWSYGGDF